MFISALCTKHLFLETQMCDSGITEYTIEFWFRHIIRIMWINDDQNRTEYRLDGPSDGVVSVPREIDRNSTRQAVAPIPRPSPAQNPATARRVLKSTFKTNVLFVIFPNSRQHSAELILSFLKKTISVPCNPSWPFSFNFSCFPKSHLEFLAASLRFLCCRYRSP